MSAATTSGRATDQAIAKIKVLISSGEFTAGSRLPTERELTQRFGVPGDFARAYVIAHEYGHHIQNLLGVMDRGGGMGARGPERGADSESVRTELQADCYAGVWAFHANQQFSILQNGDVEGALRAATSVGDDTLQKESQGYIVPDSFTHGSSAQRVRWFQRGLDGGRVDGCDTFSARSL